MFDLLQGTAPICFHFKILTSYLVEISGRS